MNRRTFLAVLAMVCMAGAFTAPGASPQVTALILKQNNEDNCNANLNAIYAALRLYADKNKGQFPAANNLEGLSLLGKYGLPPQNLYCATHKGKPAKKWNIVDDKNCSYVYFGGFTLNPKDKNNGNLPLVCDKLNDKHINVLLVNGTVTTIEIKKSKDKITSYRMLIEVLNTTYKYPKQVLKALQLKAAVLDNGK